jgi:hypothetical protein
MLGLAGSFEDELLFPPQPGRTEIVLKASQLRTK